MKLHVFSKLLHWSMNCHKWLKLPKNSYDYPIYWTATLLLFTIKYSYDKELIVIISGKI